MERRIAVVHLVWGPLGSEVLRAFVRSYRQLDPGEHHELVVVFNAVEPGKARGLLLGELAGVPHRLLELEHPVQDLAAYFEVAALLPHERVCFLNSYSEPLVDGWLALLARAEGDPAVGVAGASASWASHSSHLRYLIGLGGPYARVYRDRVRARSVFTAPRERAAAGEGVLVPRIAKVGQLARQLTGIPAFPSPHLRSNAFLIERELMLGLRPSRLADKADSYVLESGRHSLTRQLRQMGLEARVMGRDGIAYGAADWPASNTFWQGAQENLLIADNQTRAYEHADFATRSLLAAQAWGDRAAPAQTSTAAARSGPAA